MSRKDGSRVTGGRYDMRDGKPVPLKPGKVGRQRPGKLAPAVEQPKQEAPTPDGAAKERDK